MNLNKSIPRHLKTMEMLESLDFIENIKKQREIAGKSILNFKFQEKRAKHLTICKEVKVGSFCIAYWMSRDQRVQDNWAFLYAQKLALEKEIPFKVLFCLVPKFLDATIRHYDFLLNGLKEVSEECRSLNIDFHLLMGPSVDEVPKFVSKFNVGALVCDMSPLKVPINWIKSVRERLPADVPLIKVDAHNVVPVWMASDRDESTARSLRPKINQLLPMYLTEFPAVIQHPFSSDIKVEPTNFEVAFKSLEVDNSVEPVKWARPGYTGGMKMLYSFIKNRLQNYKYKRNNPSVDGQSNLSSWLHFGQISAQRAILEVKKHRAKFPESVDKFVDEALIWREVADNYCYYNKDYDNMRGMASWAVKTLNDHRKDNRTHVYSLKVFDNAATHEQLWNAAQNQLKEEGKMHGYLRMYWAKKILEWSESPEEALRIAIYLNDRYSMDGRDANGYNGIMWSIGGVHDGEFDERRVYGKIRYMSLEGCKRKFDVNAFIKRYSGAKFNKQ